MNKILIIDDDEDLVLLLSRRLSKAGFQVEAAYDGHQGTDYAHQIKPDAIILDINMPGGGGVGVLSRLKLSANTKRIPIVVFTGAEDSTTLEAIKMTDINGLFKKPDGLPDMIQKIEELLSPFR